MQTVGAGEAKQTLSAACSGGQGTPSSSEHHNRYSAVTKEWLLSETARCMCFSLHMYTTLKAVWLYKEQSMILMVKASIVHTYVRSSSKRLLVTLISRPNIYQLPSIGSPWLWKIGLQFFMLAKLWYHACHSTIPS